VNSKHYKKYLYFFPDHPVMVIVIVGLISLLALCPLRYLEFSNALEDWFPASKEYLEKYNDFLDHFGSDARIIIIYRDDDLFSREGIETNRDLTSRLHAHPNVSDVMSLTGINMPRMVGTIPVLMPLLIPGDENNDQWKELILRQQICIDNIISKDGKATGITLILKETEVPASYETLEDVREVLKLDEFRFKDYYLVGSIPFTYAMNQLVRKETLKFFVLCFMILCALLIIRFRNVWLALFPVITALVTVIWSMSLFSVVGSRINMVTGIVPVILFIVCLATSVHILVRFVRKISSNSDKMEAIRVTSWELFRPCLFSNLTTMAAFGAFVFIDLIPIRTFGIFTMTGTAISFILNFSLLPALLIFSKRPSGTRVFSMDSNSFPRQLTAWVLKYRRYILVTSLVIFSLAVIGISRLSVETDQLTYLKKTHPERKANELAREWFDGIFPVELVITGETAGRWQTKEMIARLERIENELTGIREIEVWHSAVILLRGIAGLLKLPADDYNGVYHVLTSFPDTAGGSQNFLRMYLTPAAEKARISIRTKWMTNKEFERLAEKLDSILIPMAGQLNFSYTITGVMPVYLNIYDRLRVSQSLSILISFVLIFIMILILFRKLLYAATGILPNILPILTTLGIMGWSGVEIDVGTVLIAAISLGIAIDDTIHFLNEYQLCSGKNKEYTARFVRVYSKMGEPIILTSVLVCLGFIVMVFSSYLPIVYFGIFVSLNIVFALMYDLLLIPAIISTTGVFNRSDRKKLET